MIQKSILFICIFFFGLGTGYFVFSTNHIKTKAKVTECPLNTSFENLSNELNDYTRLSSASEKLRKAEEILGKVMVLFLANVALKFEPEVEEYFLEVNSNQKSRTNLGEKDQGNENGKIIIQPEEKVNQIQNDLYVQQELDTRLIPRELEGKVEGLRSRVLKSPQSEFFKAKKIETHLEYSDLAGDFSGHLFYYFGKRKGQTIDMKFSSHLEEIDGKLQGDYLLILSERGEIFSRNAGSGNNRQIKKATSKKEFFLEVSPSSFIQVFTMSSGDLIGNFYEDNQFLGQFRLTRDN